MIQPVGSVETAATAGAARAEPRWHAIDASACAARLVVDPAEGLADDEVARRRAAHGANVLPEPPDRSALAAFASQFRGPLVILLAVAGGVTIALGETPTVAAIFAILVLNAVMGFVQERRAADAIAALRRMAAPSARVRRRGGDAVVPAGDLVPGDVVVFEAGDRVPADARLVRAHGFSTNEAALTGESAPVAKDAAAICDPGAAVADRRNMAWTGTIAATGTAEAVVTATGARTEFGRIAALVEAGEEPETPLQARLRTFGRLLARACAGVVVLVFALGLARGHGVLEMLLSAVSLAVAAVPEGLPAVVTIALALGVTKMARRGAIVRRLPAVETLGCTTVICSDKTGTLTVGEMTVRTVATLGHEVDVAGAADHDAAFARDVLRAAVAASTARGTMKDGRLVVSGDPTEGALVVAAAALGTSAEALDREEPVVASLPFDAVRKRMSIVRDTSRGRRSYVKGAPETLLPLCDSSVREGRVVPLSGTGRTELAELNERLAQRGLRVLAVAVRGVSPDGDATAVAEAGLTFLGFVGMRDPPRPSALAAVAACRAAGIRVVMVTGDQAATALAIAIELGIAGDASQVRHGSAVSTMSDEALAADVEGVAVWVRAEPEHKLRIVRAWKSRGHVVAVTGDGVNDAPALRGADIGVAMGRSGTDVAKDAAALIVTDDDFATIVAAVEEGRRIFENIRKTLLYLLSGNLGEILVMTAAVVAGLPLPLLPIQLLWVNFVTDGLPALALAADPAEPDVLRRPPRRAGSEIADRAFLVQMAASGLLVAAVTLTGFLYGLRAEGSLERARTYAFSILVFAEVLRAFAARSRTRTLFEIGALSNLRLAAVVTATIALQFWIHHSGAFGGVLRTGGLSWSECGVTLALGAVPVTVIECAKLVRRWLGADPAA